MSIQVLEIFNALTPISGHVNTNKSKILIIERTIQGSNTTFTITAESTVFEPRAITQQNAHSTTGSRTKTPVAFETGFSVPKNAFINRANVCFLEKNYIIFSPF
jgi:hypothetical protein